MYIFSCCFVVLALLAKGTLSDSSWTYSGDTGPDHWCELDISGNQCCGSRQSPIVIDEDTVIQSDYYIDFQGLDTVWPNMTLKNDGHTVILTVPSTFANAPQLTVHTDPKIDPSDIYLFDTLHFHFGNNDSHGSEHLINGDPRPMEMHVVFYNEKYGSFVASKNYTDGIIVIGVQFTIGNHNFKWEPLMSALDAVPWYQQTTTIEPGFAIQKLLPLDLSDSFNYEGSLTTPACNEAVTWFVLVATVHLSEVQMNHFRVLHNVTEDAEPRSKKVERPIGLDTSTFMFNNYRPTQDLNDRPIYRQNPQFAKYMQRRLQSLKANVHNEIRWH